jgi:hypothetical protein
MKIFINNWQWGLGITTYPPHPRYSRPVIHIHLLFWTIGIEPSRSSMGYRKISEWRGWAKQVYPRGGRD